MANGSAPGALIGGGLGTGRAGFGTGAVFLTTLSTILGAILFLRLGYAVAHVSLLGTLAIIVLGHLVTVPTSMAIAEIATNQRVEGGGVYFMLSRSFGLVIGGAIGIALYLSQAISIAFYVIAFAEAFKPVFAWLDAAYGIALLDLRIVSVPSMLVIAALMRARGAAMGLSVLYVVIATLFASLALFFAGPAIQSVDFDVAVATVENSDSFFRVFAICFPAFTGLTAGVGLSGDLRDPKRSIPLGTLGAVVTGLAVYLLVAWKLASSATPDQLAGDALIMSQIALLVRSSRSGSRPRRSRRRSARSWSRRARSRRWRSTAPFRHVASEAGSRRRASATTSR